MTKTVRKCRVALIARPVNKKLTDLYIHLGEIYDENTKHVRTLRKFRRDLDCLYPFRCYVKHGKVTCFNVEDFRAFQRKYSLTQKIHLSKPVKDGVYTFRSPFLYDLTCKVPVFSSQASPEIKIAKREAPTGIFIVFPYKNPLLRANVLNACLYLYKEGDTFVLLGDKRGENKDTIATLACRYLLKRVKSSA